MIRPFDEADRSEVNRWWAARSSMLLDACALPETGFIEDGVAAGWIYLTNSSMAYIAWMCTNPDVSEKARVSALKSLISHMSEFAKSEGYLVVRAASAVQSLSNVFDQCGFVRSEIQQEFYKGVI